MGYTHYWSQSKNFTKAEWAQVTTDITAILNHVQHVQNVPLADWEGTPGIQPEFNDKRISFNGVGDESCETFAVNRVRPPEEKGLHFSGPNDFCKTSRDPYDIAVTACLSYLATVAESHSVTSDGHGKDWLAGVEVAKQALPNYANILDIPLGVREDDRWIGPWAHHQTESYHFNFCVDGKAYIFDRTGKRWYQFPDHKEAAEFFQKNKDVINAYGSFDAKRCASLKRSQNALFKKLFNSAELFYPDRLASPPAFVRPNEFVEIQDGGRYLNLDELLAGVGV